jgi:hypothetical protein
MAFPRPGAVGGRDGGQSAAGSVGVTLGRQPAVCRRCKGGAASPEAMRVPRAPRARPSATAARDHARPVRVTSYGAGASRRTARSARP